MIVFSLTTTASVQGVEPPCSEAVRKARLASRTSRKPPSPVFTATVAPLVLRARNGFRVVSGSQGQIGQLIERLHAFLTLALQETTKTPIFGWCHNEGDEPTTGRLLPAPHATRVRTPAAGTARGEIQPDRHHRLRGGSPWPRLGTRQNRHCSVLSVPRRCSSNVGPAVKGLSS